MESLLLHTKNRVCPSCGITFESTAFEAEIAGQRVCFGEIHCPRCVKEKEDELSEQSKGSTQAPVSSWEDICPPAYRGFDITKLPPACQGVAEKVLSWKKGPKGIGLMGHSKAGKTWLMFELQRRWHEHGAKVCATSGTEFAYVCGDPDQAARRDLIERMIKADLLFIDDLGKEKMTDRVEADLFHVIEQRRRFQKPVFVTVNSDGSALASRMSDDGGAPIINRLREDVCEFTKVA